MRTSRRAHELRAAHKQSDRRRSPLTSNRKRSVAASPNVVPRSGTRVPPATAPSRSAARSQAAARACRSCRRSARARRSSTLVHHVGRSPGDTQCTPSDPCAHATADDVLRPMTRPTTRAPGPRPSPSLNHLDAGELLASVPSTTTTVALATRDDLLTTIAAHSRGRTTAAHSRGRVVECEGVTSRPSRRRFSRRRSGGDTAAW